jgi:hypothetical protein
MTPLYELEFAGPAVVPIPPPGTVVSEDAIELLESKDACASMDSAAFA